MLHASWPWGSMHLSGEVHPVSVRTDMVISVIMRSGAEHRSGQTCQSLCATKGSLASKGTLSRTWRYFSWHIWGRMDAIGLWLSKANGNCQVSCTSQNSTTHNDIFFIVQVSMLPRVRQSVSYLGNNDYSYKLVSQLVLTLACH